MALTEKLTAVADAIRAKSGNAGGLTLAQMPDEIANIKTGAELNFSVVGNPKPSNPAANTIWVDTDVEITGWHFNTIEPENPIPGMVWIYHSTTSSAKFNALKENGISLNPWAARQYIDGAWSGKPAAIWKDGEWVSDWSPYLCNRGDQCVDFTGGWDTMAWKVVSDAGTTAQTYTLERKEDHLYFTKTGAIGAVMHTIRKIDLTNVKAIHFKGEMSPTTKTNWVAFHVWSSLGGNAWATNSKATVQSTSTGKQGFVLDVSSLTGSYYLGFGIYAETHYIKLEDLYLEVA